jgi:hypothetical protein
MPSYWECAFHCYIIGGQKEQGITNNKRTEKEEQKRKRKKKEKKERKTKSTWTDGAGS